MWLVILNMQIDLKKVPIRNIDFDSVIEIPRDYYQNTKLLDLKDVHLEFHIFKNNEQDDVLNLNCSGTFVLEDARTLDAVDCPFQVSLDEKIALDSEFCGVFLKNSQNTLDILSILWENIVLEIPISYTIANELDILKSETQDGKNNIDEIDPRLAPLMELLDKEKE